MSALAIILTAAMAVPASGPERVSGEAELKLDLRGEWEGSWQDSLGYLWEATLRNGRLECKRRHANANLIAHGTFKNGDEKKGIYKWEKGQVFICFDTTGKGRPTSFRGGDGQSLYILHPVKPAK